MRVSKQRSGVSFAVVDLSTGEVVSEHVEFTKQADKFIMEGGYGIVALVFFSKLAELKLSPDAYRLCARVMASANFGGLVNKTNEEYAQELLIHKNRVSALMGKLHKVGVIHRIGPRTVFINPNYFFRGTAKAQNEAVKEWGRLHTPKLVSFGSEDQKTA
jgi:hypothetical protein